MITARDRYQGESVRTNLRIVVDAMRTVEASRNFVDSERVADIPDVFPNSMKYISSAKACMFSSIFNLHEVHINSVREGISIPRMFIIKRVPVWNSSPLKWGKRERKRNGKKTARNPKVYLSYLLTLKCREVFVSFAKLRENDNANIFAEILGCVWLTTAKVPDLRRSFAKNKMGTVLIQISEYKRI